MLPIHVNAAQIFVAASAALPVQDIATVQAVQRALRAEGYDLGPTDGTLNAKTVQALKRAQQERGLEPTGKLDRRTAAALGVNPESARSRPDAGFIVRPPRD